MTVSLPWVQAANQEGNEVGSCNQRMRASVTNGLKKKLKEIMGDFQSLRTKIQVCCLPVALAPRTSASPLWLFEFAFECASSGESPQGSRMGPAHSSLLCPPLVPPALTPLHVTCRSPPAHAIVASPELLKALANSGH